MVTLNATAEELEFTDPANLQRLSERLAAFKYFLSSLFSPLMPYQ